MSREQDFQNQLKRDNERVVNELLTNPEWTWLKEFYHNHFDEIEQLLVTVHPRLVLEDFYSLEPKLKAQLSENHLFIYQINCAIRENYLSLDMF